MDNAGVLHITEKVQPDVVKVFAVVTDEKTVGSAWHTLLPKDNVDYTVWSKAMAVYLNSTLGSISILGIRTFKKLTYPRWGVDNIRSISVPEFNEQIIKILSAAYDEYADKHIGIYSQPTSIRKALDNAVSVAFGISKNVIDRAREELAKEPMITGKRYEM